MGSNSPYYVDPWSDSPHYAHASPSAAVANFTSAGQTFNGPQMTAANPHNDDYPQHFVQAHSQFDPDHQDPYSENLSFSRKRQRSHTPPRLNGDPQSNEPPLKRKKRDRPHKKKEAREAARAAAAPAALSSQSFALTLEESTKFKHGEHGASNGVVAPRRLQVDDPIHVPRGPTSRIVSDPSASPYLQYFHATESSYATTLCEDTAHWTTTHEDDIFVPTAAPSRILLSDLRPPTSPRPKHRDQRQLVDPPRKLLVLDLNGSLLWRTSLKMGARRRKAFRRPYLGVLAQYLAHERTTQTMVAFPNQPGRLAVPLESYADDEANSGRGGVGRGDEVTVLAPLDAMIWSSVQPQNVVDMVDGAFGSLQAALRAVWTRSMIGLSQSAYYQKTQTIKDLRRIWWDTKEAYTRETTTLVDDSPLKARLQPYNQLLIPEYIRKTKDEIEGDPDADRILLAIIGILEEMRSQSNIPAWTRRGRIWDTKGCPASTEGLEEGADTTETTVPATLEDPTGETDDVKSDMSISSADAASELGAVALQWWEDEGVVQHWVERATLVLNEMSIPVVPGNLDPEEDTALYELRSRRRGY